MRTWEITQIYYNLPCYKCRCEWVPNSESLLLLDNEMLKCIFSVMNICLVRECLTGFTNLVLCWIIIHRSSTWPRKLCPATVAVPETILVTLSPYGAVPALGTLLFVVSAHLHALRESAWEAGIGNPNLRKLPLFAHSHKSTWTRPTLSRAWANAHMGSSSGFQYEDHTRRHEATIR